MLSWLGSIILAVLSAFGLPLFIAILSAAMMGFYFTEVPLAVAAIELYRLIDTPMLIALPLFTFAGYILAETKLSVRLVRFTSHLMGWLPAGLSIVSFLVCAFFTAFTGASGVTIVAVGALLFPALLSGGYSERFSLGLVTTSGSLGLLLAPSLPLILYGVIAQQMDLPVSFTIRDLFVAGVFPAFLMILALAIYSIWETRGQNFVKEKYDTGLAIQSLKDLRWDIPLPFIVLGGIYSGFFAVSEAAAVTAFYVLVVYIFVRKEISLQLVPNIVKESMVMVGGILLILGVSLAFTNFLIDAEIPQHLFSWISNFVENKFAFLFLLNIVLLILGAILDIFSALVIMTPLILPLALNFGVDPVHLGIIFLANMQIGYFTPPIGMNLFIASYRFRKPISEIYRATIPFMFVLLFVLILITYLPELSLFMLDR
ncbi:MAG: C4-dicarboxylate ABC transporter [Gammaproteobacteria bacterium]|nr:C4-dicarboxylate ABC transporter [Gammaproteobacteria bacterium]